MGDAGRPVLVMLLFAIGLRIAVVNGSIEENVEALNQHGTQYQENYGQILVAMQTLNEAGVQGIQQIVDLLIEFMTSHIEAVAELKNYTKDLMVDMNKEFMASQTEAVADMKNFTQHLMMAMNKGCLCVQSVNLALGKPAYQSSTFMQQHGPYWANFSNDGNRQTTLNSPSHSCSHTNDENYPWWAVDLGQEMCIVKVIFVNRGDGSGYRSKDFIIGVTNDSPVDSPPTLGSYKKCGQWNGIVADGATVELQCQPGTRGRYAILQIPHQEYLNFCELEVYGCES